MPDLAAPAASGGSDSPVFVVLVAMFMATVFVITLIALFRWWWGDRD